jgi:aspartate 4-decarboxylase
MRRDDAQPLAGLSPFELKNRLVALASRGGTRAMLNAGRGNPNWVALEPRLAFERLSAFALAESRRAAPAASGFGGLPERQGLYARLQAWLATLHRDPGAQALSHGIAWAHTHLGIDPQALAAEWVDGVLGDHYPLPVRMLAHAEALVRAHLVREVFGGDAQAGAFELFAVEGASAGIADLFQSLVHAGLLKPGDRIAVGVPIFTPYLEVPRLPEYRFEVVPITQDPAADWRYPRHEIDRLRDPTIRAFLVVNPSNPTGAAIDGDTLGRLAEVVRERPDLILITDDVYGPFVEGFRSLASVAPANTVLLYSFSKFWGATGLRLGVVGVHARNAFDARLSAGSPAQHAAAQDRYGSISTDPQRLRLIDRMVADSRAVGLNHTAGLSSPQQVQMALFALDGLLDVSGTRKREARAIVTRRRGLLFEAMGLPAPDAPHLSRYYATLDLAAIARARHGVAFARTLAARCSALSLVLELAEAYGVVVLEGTGFAAPPMSVRVSLANLPDDAYPRIGRAIVALIDDHHRRGRDTASGTPVAESCLRKDPE